MNQRDFIRRRRDAWKRFENLVDRLDRVSLSKLPAARVQEFSRLFRELSNDLAIIRSRAWGRGLVSYLNNLVARGHNSFYSAPAGNAAAVGRFLAAGYPRLFRANIGYFLTAAILFFLPGGLSWAVIQHDPSLASRVIPGPSLAQMNEMYGPPSDDDEADSADVPGETTTAADPPGKDADNDADDEDMQSDEDESFDDEDDWSHGFGEQRALMAGFYVKNNVGIALACFGRGILLGVGTVYTLLFNGIFIGAVGGYVVSQGNGERFLSFVISHGSFELTAIAVAGGAGLMLGNALVHPGQRGRLEALRVRGLEAVQIAAGAAVMLGIAALIEAFWSPSGVPVMLKYVVGSGLWVLVFLYLGLAGRGEADA